MKKVQIRFSKFPRYWIISLLLLSCLSTAKANCPAVIEVIASTPLLSGELTPIDTLPADGHSIASIFVIVKSAGGGACSDADLEWQIIPSGNGQFADYHNFLNGTYANTYIAGTTPGKVTIVVSAKSTGVSGSVEITLVEPQGNLPSTEDFKLTASDGRSGDNLGQAVAVSGDNAIAGAPLNSVSFFPKGSAYIVTRTEESWIQQAKLNPSDIDNQVRFGGSVAISGESAIVGDPGNEYANAGTGSAHIFVDNGNGWTERQKLLASDAQSLHWFGYAVAIDGDTAVIGAPLDDDFGASSGAAYVFVHNGDEWIEQAKLTPSDGKADDRFGHSVAVTGDTVIVGTLRSEKAYIFVRQENHWDEQSQLIPSDGLPGYEFGRSVGISGDVAVVGSRFYMSSNFRTGTAYVFLRNGNQWIEQQKLFARDTARDDEFGFSVSIDRDMILVGARKNDHPGRDSQGRGFTDAGSAYLFVRNGNQWVEQQKLIASDAQLHDDFGYSVALGNGTAIVGAPEADDEDNRLNMGKAYIY